MCFMLPLHAIGIIVNTETAHELPHIVITTQDNFDLEKVITFQHGGV